MTPCSRTPESMYVPVTRIVRLKTEPFVGESVPVVIAVRLFPGVDPWNVPVSIGPMSTTALTGLSRFSGGAEAVWDEEPVEEVDWLVPVDEEHPAARARVRRAPAAIWGVFIPTSLWQAFQPIRRGGLFLWKPTRGIQAH